MFWCTRSRPVRTPPFLQTGGFVKLRPLAFALVSVVFARDAGDGKKNNHFHEIASCAVIPPQSVNFFSFSPLLPKTELTDAQKLYSVNTHLLFKKKKKKRRGMVQ